jgi:hypothetical protein
VSKREITPANEAGLFLTPNEALLALFLVMAGRGGTGKTFLLRWICERALNAGRSVVIADGDRTNRSLPRFLDGVLTPPSANDPVVLGWLEAIIGKQVEEHFNVIVDLGGGDLVLKRMALELALQAFLQRHGITPAILHMLNPEVESLSYLTSLEEKGLFAPERTALILNEGLVAADNDDDERVFDRVKEHPVFKAAIRRGAIQIVMPRLVPAMDINARHLSFADAAAGKTKEGLPPLNIFRRERVAIWLRAMETAFAPIAEWLP